MRHDMSEADRAGFEHSHRQRLEQTRWSSLDNQPADTPIQLVEDALWLYGPFLVALAILGGAAAYLYLN